MSDDTHNTASVTNIKKWLRATLLAYENANGDTARDTLKERFYDTRARDTQIVFPYAVATLALQNDGRYNGIRLMGEYEVQVFGRPWAQLEAIEAVADMFDQCMHELVLNTDGLIFQHTSQRAVLPPAAQGSAVDAEVAAVRLSYTLVIWPSFLTSLSSQ